MRNDDMVDGRIGGEDGDNAPDATLVLPKPQPVRRATTARPIRPEDTALVEHVTLMLRVVEAVPADPRELAKETTAGRTPVTIVPRAPDMAAVWAPPPVPRRRVRSALLIWGLASVVIVTALSAAAPLAGRFVPQIFVPSAARSAANPNAALTGPWASMSGAVDVLGIGGGAGPGVKAPGSAGIPVQKPPPPAPKPTPTHTASPSKPANPPSSGISRPLVSPWPPSNPYMYVPGHPAFAVQPNGFYSWAFGQCTWWAQWERRDENLTHMGNAMYWAAGAARRGYHVGTVPVAGATVVFQPGVQGAGGAGHVAHVVAVYPGGWFLVSEMNYYWNGGGWGRVDYRFAHSGWGVQFIY